MTNWVVGFAAAFHVVLAAFERTPPPCHAVSGLRAATQGCLSHHAAASSGHEGVKVPAVEEEAVQGLIQLKSLLYKIQHLDYDTGFGADTANSTPRVWSSPSYGNSCRAIHRGFTAQTRAKQHWRLVRRVMVLKKFTFLSAAAVQR